MKSRLMLVMAAALLVAGACGRPKENIITGEVDATEVDVSVKIPGRISRVMVREGDAVKKGQVLGYLESREMEGRLQTVQAACAEAEEQFGLAEKSFARVKNLFDGNVVSRQQYDEASYKYQAARQKVAATRGQLNEVKAAYDELMIKAPLDGEVVQVVAHQGEIVSPGYPVVTIVDLDDQWVIFNVREDRLPSLRKGQSVQVVLPALGKTYPFTVTYISALGAFAKWKATNEQGSFDLKMFESRARHDGTIEGLRPGMTALIRL
jgi:HlyD family secretion protein